MSFNGFVRKIYDSVIHLSSSEHALAWLFVISFAESSFFPIPPDIMLIPMILATPKKAWKIAGICTLASVIGAYLGYFIGFVLREEVAIPLLKFYKCLDKFNEFSSLYEEYGIWFVFGAGITPFPYKLITIASGMLELDLAAFTVASIIARGLRFFLIAWLLKTYGERMRLFIEKNLGWLSVLFLVLLIGGFLLFKLF